METKEKLEEEPGERQWRGSIEHNDDVIDQRINKEVSVASLVIVDTDAVDSERNVLRARNYKDFVQF